MIGEFKIRNLNVSVSKLYLNATLNIFMNLNDCKLTENVNLTK